MTMVDDMTPQKSDDAGGGRDLGRQGASQAFTKLEQRQHIVYNDCRSFVETTGVLTSPGSYIEMFSSCT